MPAIQRQPITIRYVRNQTEDVEQNIKPTTYKQNMMFNSLKQSKLYY